MARSSFFTARLLACRKEDTVATRIPNANLDAINELADAIMDGRASNKAQ
jgi:hypothetical protein